MNDKLRKDVQNLLLDYEERLFLLALFYSNKIEHTLADDLKTTTSLLETSVDLLRKCIVDDYKIIPQDQKHSVQINLAKSIMIEETLRDFGEKE